MFTGLFVIAILLTEGGRQEIYAESITNDTLITFHRELSGACMRGIKYQMHYNCNVHIF